MYILLQLLSGVAMLSFGIYLTKSGVLRAAGSRLNVLVARTMSSRIWPLRALFAGLFTTMLVQSSNAAAMLVSSFMAKNLIALTPALIIMLGADLGTALMARILTFDLRALGPLFFTVGVTIFLARRKTEAGKIGRILIGLGLILLALTQIVTSTRPLIESETTQLILDSLDGEITFAVIFGALLAMLCYSSLAAVLLTAVIANTGHLTLETGWALVIGANLGSCCLEILGSLGQGVSARRVMLGNTLFKLTISAVALPLLPVFARFDLPLTPGDQVIWFHLCFNLAVCFVLLPLAHFYAKLLIKIIPEPEAPADESTPMYLDDSALDSPSLAISNAVRETLRLGGFLHEMMRGLSETLTGKARLKQSLEYKFGQIERLSLKVRVYLEKIEFNGRAQSERWHQVFSAAVSSVQAGDLICHMISDLSFLNNSPEVNLSAHARADLLQLCKLANENLSLAQDVFMTGRENGQGELQRQRTQYKRRTDQCSVRHLGKLNADSIAAGYDVSSLVLILIEDLRQLNNIYCTMADTSWVLLRGGKEQSKDQAEDENRAASENDIAANDIHNEKAHNLVDSATIAYPLHFKDNKSRECSNKTSNNRD